jgi:hypothetical protein
MDEYKSRLSIYLSDMVREELKKYDGGFTDEMNDQRGKNAEVLGYKLSGTSDINEGSFKSTLYPKKGRNDKIRFQNAPSRLYKLKKITVGNVGIPDKDDPSGTSYMFVAPGNRKEYFTKKTWRQAMEKGWLSLESVNESTKEYGKTLDKIAKDRQLKSISKKDRDTLIKISKLMKGANESINEKISKEEWARYPKYARKLKPYMQKLLKVRLKVRVIKQANHNPWIEIRVARFGKDIIPNDFRKEALKVIGGSKARDMDNINYGNIRTNSVSMKYDQWVKLLGNKVKESTNEAKISVEPNWEGMWRFFKRMAKTNPGDWYKIQRAMGKEWTKINKMASKKGWVAESTNEGKLSSQIKKAVMIAIQMSGNMTGATDKIEKIKKGLSKDKKVADALRLANESIDETKERDYKAEYKKYGSSTKAKKYRAELNQYNRKKGTYGNGDGKDASHKGGKIVGFEKQSTNRGRREKSRLKKENIREDIGIETYLGGILKSMKKAGLKLKTAQVMKWGWSKSKDKIGFLINVLDRERDEYTLQIEVDRDGNLWYLSAPKDMKLGKWADTNKIVRSLKAISKLPDFGQSTLKRR